MSEKNDDSGKVMLILTKEANLLVPMIKLCDKTRYDVLRGKMHLEKWTYSEILRQLGMEIENKDGRDSEAGSLMFENAKRMGIYEKIIEMPSAARKVASERGLKLSNWELTGLLDSLGLEIEKITGTEYPVQREENYYANLY
ncbi:hypothetical protein [Methanolobus halotolerans]|uniref:Uncharacterized protein n=1 Tax=Methanolobus halotolerans TaxID=2052935 RepID=A0A4E0QAB1_9EURY|nr:hypothetical protein [Methanolobus halotolerans]TGC09367.1 hypothetical protein CUN85_05885 [Methanolobus halotolerans]